jgi:hypothetical protein
MNEYEQQALDFLIKTGTNLDVEFRYTGPVDWDTDGYHHDHYRVTLKRNGREFGFDFTDSRKNSLFRRIASIPGIPDDKTLKELHKMDKATWRAFTERTHFGGRPPDFNKKWRNYQPTAYDVLAGLDAYECGSFDDFCAEFGYNELPMSEYPRVMGIYAEVQRQSQELHRMFSEEELDMLREIS